MATKQKNNSGADAIRKIIHHLTISFFFFFRICIYAEGIENWKRDLMQKLRNPQTRKPGSLEMKLPRVSISGLPASLKKNIPHKVSKKKIKSELSGSE